jgi:outer membrane cobalamin receptor
LAGFALVNLRLDYKFSKHVTVSSKVNNAGNKKYQTVRNFNSLDQLFFVSLAYKD